MLGASSAQQLRRGHIALLDSALDPFSFPGVAARAGMIEQWHMPGGTNKHNAALARLLQLRVLEAVTIPHSAELGYALHQTLARHLRAAVYGGCDHALSELRTSNCCCDHPNAVTVPFLAGYGNKCASMSRPLHSVMLIHHLLQSTLESMPQISPIR